MIPSTSSGTAENGTLIYPINKAKATEDAGSKKGTRKKKYSTAVRRRHHRQQLLLQGKTTPLPGVPQISRSDAVLPFETGRLRRAELLIQVTHTAPLFEAI